MNFINTFSFHSPIGFIEIKSTETAITAVHFVDSPIENTKKPPDIILQCKDELEDYFSGKRTVFSVKTAPQGSDFQIRVWDELLKIRFAETTSYISIAEKINIPTGARAVGLANGQNPIAIIIPCHRIIGKNGKLTGYAGGLRRKQWLLDHEGNVSGKNRSLF